MIIAIDVRPLMGGNTSGVEVYIHNLLTHLLREKDNTYILYMNATSKEEALVQKLQKMSRQSNVKIVHTRYPNKLFNALLTFFRWPKLDRLVEKRTGKKPEAFLLPDLRPSPLGKNIKKVSVVHDLAFEHFPQFFSWRTRLWYALLNPRREVKESQGIIAVSNFTKYDIVKTYGIDEHKIAVIPEGVKESFGQDITLQSISAVQKKYQLPQQFFLFLSTLEPRKNINNLIEGFKRWKKKNNSDIKLVIAGKTNRRIFSKIPHYDAKDILFPGFIEEEDKAILYHLAEAFIYPSIFEGFGLPLLEAMKVQTPLIASNTSSIPEVVEDAALLIDPDNPEELAEALEEIQKPHVRKALKHKMRERIPHFTWERCAAETLITIYLSS